MNYKKANIMIFYLIIIIIITTLIFSVSILYIQIDLQLKSLRSDLEAIVKSCALKNCSKEDLKYYKYKFDLEEMKKNIQEIYDLKKVNNVVVEDLYYDKSDNKFVITLNINFKTLINFNNHKNINIYITQDVKFQLLEVINK